MTDRAAIRARMAGAVLAAICCAAIPLLAVGLPIASLGAWFAGAGLNVLIPTVAGLGAVAWAARRRVKAASGGTAIHKENATP